MTRTRCTGMTWMVAIAILVGFPAVAAEIDRVVPLSPGGDVSVELTLGSLRVEGWDRSEVALSGVVDGDIEQVEIRADGDAVRIEIDPRRGRRDGTSLILRVPRLGELDVEAVACNVDLAGIEAREARIEVAQGDISVRGTIRDLDIEAVAGKVDVAGDLDVVRIESAAGAVNVTGVRSEADIESISGPLRLEAAAPLREVVLSSGSGSIEYVGGLARGAEMSVETLNGSVVLAFDAGVGAEIDVETYNGRIDVDWPGADVETEDGAGPGQEMRIRLGDGSATVDVDTFNGRCTIRRRG